jgi:hypothetical protein
MNASVNHYTIVCLSDGPSCGQYLRIDPHVRYLVWQGEVYSRIPGRPTVVLYHVRSAVLQIIKEIDSSLPVEYQNFICWFSQIPEGELLKKLIHSSDLDQRLVALFTSLISTGIVPSEVFPELQDII